MLLDGTWQGSIRHIIHNIVQSSAGSAAWLAARPAEQERTGAGLLAVLREVAVEVMACDSYLNEARQDAPPLPALRA